MSSNVALGGLLMGLHCCTLRLATLWDLGLTCCEGVWSSLSGSGLCCGCRITMGLNPDPCGPGGSEPGVGLYIYISVQWSHGESGNMPTCSQTAVQTSLCVAVCIDVHVYIQTYICTYTQT